MIRALVGASGAGKSALVRTIAGLNPPFTGSVRLAGRDLARVPASDRIRLGMATVLEGRRLFSGMTVHENLMLGGFTQRDSALLRQRLDVVREIFPVLAARRNQIAGTLSGGKQQMCAIGRALMTCPKLLIIDELSSGLAPAVVDAILEALRAVRREGAALLVAISTQVASFEERGSTGRPAGSNSERALKTSNGSHSFRILIYLVALFHFFLVCVFVDVIESLRWLLAIFDANLSDNCFCLPRYR
jgi:branched-chain amino acid transport system ATP-binding protein